MNYDKKILRFFKQLNIRAKLPSGIAVMNPYADDEVFKYCTLFYSMFYNNSKERTIILGINPGRFGAGITGIPFTDPVKLEMECGIKNNLPKRRELSADFIYQVIQAFGGKKKFYNKFYFGSVSPLGFTKGGKNINYYDNPKLQNALRPFICQTLEDQIHFGINTKVAYCLGEGSNFKFLKSLNAEMNYFENIIPLSHPRFVMQYKRKKISSYIDDYLKKLNQPASFIP